MLSTISIKNFKNLDGLAINSLSRVNLITGQNNSGKSTLLEAIALYLAKCDFNFIFQLLEEKGENFNQINNKNNTTDFYLKAISSIFNNRNIGFDINDAIEISGFNSITNIIQTTKIRFVKFIEEYINQNDMYSTKTKKVVIDRNTVLSENEYSIGLQLQVGKNDYILPLDKEIGYSKIPYFNLGTKSGFQFIRTKNINREINGKLWDSITLTDKEKFVIEALKIIEPLVERIAFIEDGSRSRSAVIKLSSSNNVIPLLSMGDGINRVLTIVLALVNSENGYLLIDEFENGLHYSIQVKLWEIIFKLANELNIQVFITTHSDDCIYGFDTVLNSPNNIIEGKLLRLDNINGKIKQIEYNKDDLRIATEQHIETR